MAISLDIDEYSYHEALDRTALLQDLVGRALGEHPVIVQEPAAQELYQDITERLGALYQELGMLAATRER